jgi:aspartate-semialdehyde dehydrogenase
MFARAFIARQSKNLPHRELAFSKSFEQGFAYGAYVEDATNAGCLVIDLSGLFALEPDVPLVVPDVNRPGSSQTRRRP